MRIEQIVFVLLGSILCFQLLMNVSYAQLNTSKENACFYLLKIGIERSNFDINMPFANYTEFLKNAETYTTSSNIVGANPPNEYSNWSIFMFGNDITIKEIKLIPNLKEKLIIFYYGQNGTQFEGCGAVTYHPGQGPRYFNITDVIRNGEQFLRVIGVKPAESPNYYQELVILIYKNSNRHAEELDMLYRRELYLNNLMTQKINTYIFYIRLLIGMLIIVTISFVTILLKEKRKKENLRS